MIFKRNAYNELLNWKEKYADKYALLLEGPRRVGKTTIVKEFAKNEYKTFIYIDFSKNEKNIISCFEDIGNLDLFFRRLQIESNVELIKHESLIIFDEVQLYPKARQAIKHLISDGRYHYIETGSLISIKKNVKNILIPSEEMKMSIYPMTYEEFCMATSSNNYNFSKKIYEELKPIGNSDNRKLMRDYRIYMCVGGMPQAVEAYIEGKSFSEIDRIKREIINLYLDDFKKIDPSGKIESLYLAIPSFLAHDVKKFRITSVLNKRKSAKDDGLLFDLIDSKTVLISYNSTDPQISFSQTKDIDSYKLYFADTGLFVTSMFLDKPITDNDLYNKLLSDKLPANLGYLYENVVAQEIAAKKRELFYYTWEKKNSNHYYEVDFLISNKTKTYPIEVKSSAMGKHESLLEFKNKYSKSCDKCYILSQKEIKKEGNIINLPIYLLPFLLGNN